MRGMGLRGIGRWVWKWAVGVNGAWVSGRKWEEWVVSEKWVCDVEKETGMKGENLERNGYWWVWRWGDEGGYVHEISVKYNHG